MSEFEFTVRTHPHWKPNGEIVDVFVVELPHQCDEWEIASSEDRDAVQAQLARFVAEAEDIAAALEALEVCEHEWGPEVVVVRGGSVKRDCSKCEARVWRSLTKEERLGPTVVAAAKAAGIPLSEVPG